jgi:hypothetical protein
VACFAIAYQVRHLPTPGDISNALSSHPSAYTLSLGHMLDLTFDSFAYLRLPLIIAGVAFMVGAAGNLWGPALRNFFLSAVMMVVFFHAARVALVVFDPFLTSRPLADAIQKAPPGDLIVTGHYYPFSSVFFYLNRDALLLNGVHHNLEYGAAAPNHPDVFINAADLQRLWALPRRYYLVTKESAVPGLNTELGEANIHLIVRSGGKVVLTNLPAGN